MMKSSLMKLLLLLSLLQSSIVVARDNAIEHEYLARVIQELNHLAPLINAAERYQPSQSRIQFNYDQLRLDIELIKRGIESKLSGNYELPREFIQGDYLIDQEGTD